MSLVSEALRKARAESLAGGAHQRGVVFRTTVVLGPRGPRIRLGWLLGAAVLAAAAAGGAVAWWLLPGRATPATLPAPAAEPAARPASPSPVSATAGASPPAYESPEAVAPAPVLAHGALHATAPPPEPHPKQPTRPPATAEPQAAVAPAQGLPLPAPEASMGVAAPVTAGARERAFGLDADLGYAKLHLDYIVYRSKDPFAGINGRQVMIGTIIEGFTVEEIGPDDVRLHDAKGPVVLRTH